MALDRNFEEFSRAQYAKNGHMEPFWFRCNGASDPTEYSANLKSVQRVDDTTDFWYRLTWNKRGPLTRTYTESYAVTNLTTTQLCVTRLTDGVPTGLAAPDATREIDIGVYVDGSAAYTNSHADDHYVSGCLLLDMSQDSAEKT